MLNDDVIEKNADVISLITWLILKFLLKPKDVLYYASSDSGKV